MSRPICEFQIMLAKGIIEIMQVFEFATTEMVEIIPPLRVVTAGDELPSPVELASLAADQMGISVEFLKFSDGRGFSQGRHLRAALPAQCPVVAGGQIIPDQADYLYRAGFTHAVIAAADIGQWRRSLAAVATRFQHMDGSPRTR